ncbi:ATP-binding protein [Streptomyces sp. NPDC052020]|uniref:ATP-binding protein n=1 Tax=Streptomyces sp. NPDC052020 TaxID=3155677 RepID=UPI0034272716
MKQSVAKTLGAAALGAAFAAAGAGTAGAVGGAPDPGQALDPITRTLPVESLARSLPGAGEALTQGERAAEGGLAAVQPTAQKLPQSPIDPLAGLLGGVPVNKLPVTLPLI